MDTVSYMPSLLLSYIPALMVLVVYFILNQIFTQASVWYILVLLNSFLFVNVFGFAILAAQVQFFSVYWRAGFLANMFLMGWMIAVNNTSSVWFSFGVYMMVLTFFHTSEFVFTALYNHRDVSTDSFLLNHSTEYSLAAVVSWCEFLIEAFVCPAALKTHWSTLCVGIVLVTLGEFFRKLAMYTAGRSFNHYVQEERQADHVLVTRGVYSFVRHPSYLGWFMWSVGTQVLLANPLCLIAYTIAAWKFFKSRIVYEEFYLIKFFGRQYVEYQKRVPSGVPFVKGFRPVDEPLD